MILVKQEKLLDAYNPTVQTDNFSGDYYDALKACDLGAGNDVCLIIQCATAASGASSTYQFLFQGSVSDTSFGSPLNIVSVPSLVSEAVVMTAMVAGWEKIIKLPRLSPDIAYCRYYRLGVRIGGAGGGNGVFNAWLSNDNAVDNHPYAAGYTVL
jgi:hypothetical protein